MNIAKIITIILVIVAVATAAVYLMGQYEPTKPIHDKIMGYVEQAKTFLSSPTGIITAVGGAGGLASIVGLASQLNNAKNQITQLTSNANTQINGLQNTLNLKDNEVTSALSKLQGATETNQQLAEANKILEGKFNTINDQFTKLQNSFNVLQSTTSAEVISKLPAGTTIPQPGGGTVTVVEKTVIK